MALHVGHNCNPWDDCAVCGAKVEPPYRQRTDVCAMCGAGFTVCRCRHQLREWRESMSVKDGPGEGTWSVFAQKVVEQRDEAREEVARLRAEVDVLRRALTHIADTCVQDPDTAQFAARVRVENERPRAKNAKGETK